MKNLDKFPNCFKYLECYRKRNKFFVCKTNLFTKTKLHGISPVIATVIVVAVTIALSIMVALYFSGTISLFTSPTVTTSRVITVLTQPFFGDEIIEEKPTLRCCYVGGRYLYRETIIASYVRVMVLVGPIDNDPNTHYCLYLNVTALKPIKFIRVYAQIKANDGEPPDWVGGADVTWQDSNVPRYWYASRYWCPIREDEFPVNVYVTVEVPGP